MKPVFADTVYFLALLNPSDQFHLQTRTISEQPPGPLLTTEFVLTEVGDGLSRTENRSRFARLLQLLRSNGGASGKSWGAALLEVAGTAEGLPSDFAHNHDHYLHGAPGR